MNPTQEELIRMEVERQLYGHEDVNSPGLKNQLMSLGGGLVGGTAGYLAINPVDTFIENANVKRAALATQQQRQIEILHLLNQGHLQLDDIADTATREALKEAWDMNKEMLDDADVMRNQLSGPRKGRVYRMSDMIDGEPEYKDLQRHLKRTGRKRFLPDVNVLRNPGKLTHPAVSVGSLAGMAGGYFLADHLAKKNHTESQ